MPKRTIALLSAASVLLWAVLKWIAGQVAGNFVAKFIDGLFPAGSDPRWAAMTGALVNNALFIAIALVIVLGVYVLGAWDRRRVASSATGNTGAAAPLINPDFAHGLLVSAVTLDLDVLSGRKWNVQLGVQLENTTANIMQYVVDGMFVSLNNQVLPAPAFSNRGGILRPGRPEKFRYDVFRKVALPKEAPAIVSIEISYGPVDGPPVRHVKRGFNCTVRLSGNTRTVTWADTENVDVAI